MKKHVILFIFLITLIFTGQTNAQSTDRERPEEWEDLAYGGRFMDRFLPIPVNGPLTSDTWGGENVLPRYVDNGLEDMDWSYWGGNALLGPDGNYHLFVCRWKEDSEKGHMEWPRSIVVHAVAENPLGPYKVKESIGPGHNPETFQLADGRYVIYVHKAYYISDKLEGPWEHRQFEFDPAGKPIIEGLSNMSFVRNADGSFVMVCRGGGIWTSDTGISPYTQVSEGSVYPNVEGRFEDPVMWRTNIQYHLVVNDWFGRIAYYLRSKDGLNWIVDPGEAYLPGITRYEDGTEEDWFKYERMKVLQDELGRATQVHFAVIDTLKHDDMGSDRHSSKHICIPVTVGRQIEILNREVIDCCIDSIRVLVRAEKGFNPQKDMDLSTLRFGASDEINYGFGSQLIGIEEAGKDIILIFEGKGNGLSAGDFTAKLMGKDRKGNLLFGYARLPWVDYPDAPASISQIIKH